MNWRRLNIDPYSPLKPTNVGFIFIGPNSLSWAEDLVTVNHVTQLLSSELGVKVGFKELRLEPKFLNRRLLKPKILRIQRMRFFTVLWLLPKFPKFSPFYICWEWYGLIFSSGSVSLTTEVFSQLVLLFPQLLKKPKFF